MSMLLATPRSWPSILLAHAGTGDPTDLDAAVTRGAFAGLRAALEQGPAGTIEAIAASGLRGRGGAGYPAADKWRATADAAAAGAIPLVVANGYAADPSSRTDIELLERNPYAVLEGLAIAAIAVGAEEAIVAIRADATTAIRGLEAAIGAATEAQFLGAGVCGSERDVLVSVRAVEGAYMLGEETVLLKALAGKRGQPEQRPPHPATHGFDGRPTLVQNVQTLASVPWILVNGAAAYAGTGSRDCPGTILVSVRGPAGEGVAEVPMGTKLRDIVALGGAPAPGRQLKAILVGGPSGGILPPEALDTRFTFDDLREAGAHVGSGSVVVADDRACIVDLARVLTRFCADEACGKSIPCRIGTRRLSEIAERMADGTSRAGDLDLAADLAADIAASALCDHERLATLPLGSGLRYFREELDAHVRDGSCPAGVCQPISMASGAALASPPR